MMRVAIVRECCAWLVYEIMVEQRGVVYVEHVTICCYLSFRYWITL